MAIPTPAPVDGDAAPTQRAGRDLSAAIGVGAALGVLVLASLAFARGLFVVVLIAAIVIAEIELGAALRRVDLWLPVPVLVVGTIGTQGATWLYGGVALAAGAAATAVVAIAVVVAVDPAARRKVDCAAVVIVVGYLIVLSGCAVLLLRPADGGRRVVLFMACVVAADTGAYATGVLLGRHKLAPRISPKKTWEGLAGSLVTAAATGAILAHLFFRTPIGTGALIGVCLALAATAGDLAESYVKRRAGVKDMSSLLPGHGGLMDRLDSMLPAAAVALALLTALVPQ